MASVRTLVVDNKTMFSLGSVAMAALLGAAFMIGAHFERQDVDHTEQVKIRKEIVQIKERISGVEATLNMLVRRQVNAGMSDQR